MPLLALVAAAALAGPPPTPVTWTPFLTPEEWFGAFQSAEADFARLAPDWTRYTAVAAMGGVASETLAPTESSLTNERARLSAERASTKNELEIHRANLNQLYEQRAAVIAGSDILADVLADLEARVEESDARAELAARRLLAALEALGSGGRRALDDVSAWWDAREDLNWDLYLAGQAGGASLAKLGAAQQEAAVSCRGLGPQIVSGAADLFTAAADEEGARQALYRQREASAGTAGQSGLEAMIRETEKVVAAGTARVEELSSRIHEVDGQIELVVAQRAALAEAGFAEDGGMLRDLRVLDDRWSRLVRGVDYLEARVDAATWCQLHLHAGLTRLMVQRDGADALLTTAAAAEGGLCRLAVSEYFHAPLFQVGWAEALAQVALGGPAAVQLDADDGEWRSDGAPISGVLFRPLELIGVDNDEVLPPRRTPHLTKGPTDAGEVAAPLTVERGAHVGLAGRWLRYDGRDHVGVTLSAAWPVVAERAVRFDLGFAQDIAGGDGVYRYTDSFASRALLRERITAEVRLGPAPVRPVVTLSGGVVPPALGAVAEGSVGVEARLTDGLFLGAALAGGWTAWKDGAGAVEPAFSLGVARWL